MKPPQTMPDATVPAVVQVIPSQVWTDTGIVVRKGDSLFFSATGEIHWSQRESTVSPDGIKGLPGWTVGPGGLVGRVAGTSKIFDIGARTQPFPEERAGAFVVSPAADRGARRGCTATGGFKRFEPGPHSGAFEVTIRRGGRTRVVNHLDSSIVNILGAHHVWFPWNA
jgi:hypothetical protein